MFLEAHTNMEGWSLSDTIKRNTLAQVYYQEEKNVYFNFNVSVKQFN